MKRPSEDLAATLLEASSRLGSQGVDLSIDEMARESGVARATLYYYFSGKEDLVAFLLDDKVASAAAAMEKALAHEGSVAERLEKVVSAIYDAMARQPALCLEMPTALRNPEAFGEMLQHAEQVLLGPMVSLLEEGIESGDFTIADVSAALTFMQGAVWQLAMTRLLEEGSFDPEELTRRTMPLLLGAFGTGE